VSISAQRGSRLYNILINPLPLIGLYVNKPLHYIITDPMTAARTMRNMVKALNYALQYIDDPDVISELRTIMESPYDY
jgi:hypothetical protein